MTQKLSPHKVRKMLTLYFEGYSQSEVANKLKINQATVSLHVSKFKSLAEQQGLKAAGEEFDIMDEIESLHSLAAELRKAKLTVEEAKIGVKMEQIFQKYGIKQENYANLIQACTQMKAEGFIDSAVKLNHLEYTTGMTYQEVIAQFATTYQQLQETKENLQVVISKLTMSKEKLADINKQKKLASQGLQVHMQQIGVDMNRLKLVEDLALALKEGGISNKELQNYIQRQQLLNKAGVNLDTFVSILEKAKVVTSHDHGEELLQMLSEYGSLGEAKKALQAKVQSLGKEADGLEQQAKLKGKIEGEIAKLKAEKASLEAYVVQLYDQKNTLDHIQSEVSSLAEKKAMLGHEITELETYKDLLSDDIKPKEQKVSDLKELESKRDAVLASLSEIEAKVDVEKERWEIFESFLGLVKSSSLAELEKFVEVMPNLLSEVKQGKYSPVLLRKMILKELTGDKLQLLKCTSCQAKFAVDSLAKPSGYHCPICGLSYQIEVDQDALAILRAALAAPKLQHSAVVQAVTPVLKQSKPKDNGNG